MRRLLYVLLSVLVVSVVASCIDRPECVLDEPQLIDVLVDVHRAEGFLDVQEKQIQNPSAEEDFQREIIQSVLASHGVTRQQYDSTMMWYAQHLKLLTRVYGHVDERLTEEHERWSLQVAESMDFSVSESGDSVDLWTLRSYLVFDRLRHRTQRFWTIPSDSNFVDGDTLKWTFDVRSLVPGQRLLAQLSLNEENEGLIGHTVKLIDEPGRYEMCLQADSVQPFSTAVFALVLLQHDTVDQAPVFIDSISLLRLHPASSDEAESVTE